MKLCKVILTFDLGNPTPRPYNALQFHVIGRYLQKTLNSCIPTVCACFNIWELYKLRKVKKTPCLIFHLMIEFLGHLKQVVHLRCFIQLHIYLFQFILIYFSLIVKRAIFAYVNLAQICSSNQPVLSNEGKISSSRKQCEPLMELELTTDKHPPITSLTCSTSPHIFVLHLVRKT